MATSKIQILIEADDKASAKIRALAAGLEEVDGKSKKSAISFKTFRDAAGAAAIAIFSVKKGLDATLGAAISYNKAILDGARAASIGTEEMSRIVQAADDYGISMGEVTGALEMAQKRGFAPTIENLARLADETNAINSPTERAARLSEILGRNWATLNPLLRQGGEGIRGLTDAVEDNLVVTEEEAEKTEAMRLRIDELSDSLEGAKLSAGNFLAEGLLPIIDGIKGVGAALDEQSQRLISSAPTYEEYNRLWQEQGLAMQLFGNYLSEADFEAAKLADRASGVQDGWEAALGGLAEIEPALEEVKATVEAFHPPSIWDEIFPSPANLAQKLQDQIDFVQAGGPGLVAAMENIQSALTTGAITPEQAEEMLKPVSAAASGLAIEMGDTDIWAAAKERAHEFGIPFDEARKDIEAGITGIENIPQSIDIKINWIMENPIPPRQHGGPVWPGQPFLVGEGGPEMFMPPGPGQIINNNDTRNMTFNGGMTFNNGQDRAAAEQMFRRIMGGE